MPSRPPEKRGQLVERALPALLVVGEARRVGERPVNQGQLGLVAQRAQLDAHRRLVATRFGNVAIPMMPPGEAQPLGSLHLDILARRCKGTTAASCGALHSPS